MGNNFSTFFSGLGRFFEYPVKRKPICFYRQEDFTATGTCILLRQLWNLVGRVYSDHKF